MEIFTLILTYCFYILGNIMKRESNQCKSDFLKSLKLKGFLSFYYSGFSVRCFPLGPMTSPRVADHQSYHVFRPSRNTSNLIGGYQSFGRGVLLFPPKLKICLQQIALLYL